MDRTMVDAASGEPKWIKPQRYQGTSRVVNKVGAFDNVRLENQLTELTSLVRQLVIEQHQQIAQRETKTKSTKCIGALGGEYQYGRKPHSNRQFDNQQFWRQPYQPNLNQARHTTSRFRPVGTMPSPSQGNYQQQGPRYQALAFCQQLQQQRPQ
ncbi:hypothetical protein CR513_23768, partial [Mucuna pruriens]